METLKITRVFISDKKKDGTPLIDKNGKAYRKIAIKCDKYGDKWLSSFINRQDDDMNSWKEGDVVNVEVEENGDFLNFRVPTKLDLLESRILKLEKEMLELKGDVYESEGEKEAIIEADDLPF